MRATEYERLLTTLIELRHAMENEHRLNLEALGKGD